MIAHVILGITIDTKMWISVLKLQNSENIYVIDYEYFGEPILSNEVIYISSLDAKKQLTKYDSISFYKSMYVYPGMDGKMSSLYKK
ncbi:hypothetical protein [Planomicrobium sp. CPCC 101079]|uniref:hypothetical protein n=1 Tax=Planomicrobium sp. CPCC 101079 TaxID=2599618 RepID=UPI0011B73A9B|nr:hypothetical protein [Planomicrobium sp. CPCC 101079]TWT01863.1 hypothetical protein FQV28_14620 [Planomicrobium sp. CPCC 101079]